MKNLTAAFKTGNLRPKERVLLLAHNQMAKDETGKEILSDADKYALCEGWHPKENWEVKEYNKYNDGWNKVGFAGADTQATYLWATVKLLRAGRLVDMVVLRDEKSILTFYKDLFEKRMGSGGGALELVLQNSGLEFDYTIHRYAFDSLSDDVKKDMLALYPDAATETQYVNQEEALAAFFDGKRMLTREAKIKLANAIVESMHNKHAAFFRQLGDANHWGEEYFFGSYYGELPTLEILSKWAVYNNQMPKNAEELLRHLPDDKEYANDSEEVSDLFDSIRKELTPKLTDYAEKHQTSVGELLRQTILKWLDDGLFVDEFQPICNSNTKETCNGTDTKLPHKKVLEEWLKAKKKAEQTIQGLIDSGELKVEERVEEIRQHLRGRNEAGKERPSFKRPLKILTGKSLYALAGDYRFAEDFKKQADDLEGLGGLIMFLRECNFVDGYASVLYSLEMFKKLSEIFEIDLTKKIRIWIDSFKDDLDILNAEIYVAGERMERASYNKNNIAFLITVFTEDMLINFKKIKPRREDLMKRYAEEFKKDFGVEFGLDEEENEQDS